MYPVKLPVKTRKTRRQAVELGGLDRTPRRTEGTLADSLGLSLEHWPCLGQRRGRRLLRRAESCTDLFAWDKLCTVEDGELCYDGQAVATVAPGKKQFAVVGSKLCVFPDKKYLDLETREVGDLAARAATVPNSVSFTENALVLVGAHSVLGRYNFHKEQPGGVDLASWCKFLVYRLDDMVWDPETGWQAAQGVIKTTPELQIGDCMMLPRTDWRGNRPPAVAYGSEPFPTEYDAWGDFVCVVGETDWVGSLTGRSMIHVPLERRNAAAVNPRLDGRGFRTGDTVVISGCETFPENDRAVTIAEITDTGLVFEGEGLFTPGDETGAVTVERWVPDLDFICESDNRLMGVSSAARAVYASARGDPTSFSVAGDSWTAGVGTDGDFTGCIAYANTALFFKEDCLHRLVGASPQSYQLYTSQVPGVQRGTEGAMVIWNETLYYKSRDGIYAYSGSAPRKVSQALGDVDYDRAAAGADSRGCRFSMRRRDTGVWELLTYVPAEKRWIREDDLACRRFAALDGALFALTDDAIVALDGGGDDDGAPIPWQATFNPFTETVHERKYPSRLLLRLELAPGAWAEAGLSRDGGPFRRVWSGHDPSAATAVIPLRPGRCDSYQLRLKGEGRCVIRSLAREFTLGGVT